MFVVSTIKCEIEGDSADKCEKDVNCETTPF